MIEKNSNIIKDSKIKRIVEHNEGDKQINVLDQRFYSRDGKYYPSVTSILNYFPKNQFFHSWLKDVGHNSDLKQQTKVHKYTMLLKILSTVKKLHGSTSGEIQNII